MEKIDYPHQSQTGTDILLFEEESSKQKISKLVENTFKQYRMNALKILSKIDQPASTFSTHTTQKAHRLQRKLSTTKQEEGVSLPV
jgi:hypothetical protein